MEQQYSNLYNQGVKQISPGVYDNDYNQQYETDFSNQKSNLSASNIYAQNQFSSPQRIRTKPQIFQNTPPYLRQTVNSSNMNLSFGSPEINNNMKNNIIDSSNQSYQYQIQQLEGEKDMLLSQIEGLQNYIMQQDFLLQQERRINKSVATEYMIKMPSAERAIIQLNEENSRLQEQIDSDKKLCSQEYLKKLELENLKLTVKNKSLMNLNNQLQDSIQTNSMDKSYSPIKKNTNNNSPLIKIALNGYKLDEVQVNINDSNQNRESQQQSKLINSNQKLSNDDNDYLVQNYQKMESTLLKLESYIEILKQDNDKLEESNRILNKKIKSLQIEKETNENESQQKILKLESLVTTFEYQLRKYNSAQQSQTMNSKRDQNQNQSQAFNSPNSKIERNLDSNSNTIRILHDGDVNIKIEGEYLNNITSVTVKNI